MSTLTIIGKTIGIELEVENILINKVDRKQFDNFNINLTHDASCESVLDSLGEVPVRTNLNSIMNSGILSRYTYGGEIRTGIINTEQDYLTGLIELCSYLRDLGENTRSYRAGIHVHISFPSPDLVSLKNLINLGAHLEQVFFLLGGMGYDFRGFKNNSCYCRPITKYGPVCVPIQDGKKYAQVFTVKTLNSAKNVEDFQFKYGDLPYQGGRQYFPVRYHWLNLSPIWRIGTVEFRIFNKSLNPLYIYAVAEFCKSFISFVIKNSGECIHLNENSIYDLDKENARETLSNFIGMSKLPKDVPDILNRILELSPVNNIEDHFTYSHLQFLSRGNIVEPHWKNCRPPEITIPSEIIRIPKFVDVHNFREE